MTFLSRFWRWLTGGKPSSDSMDTTLAKIGTRTAERRASHDPIRETAPAPAGEVLGTRKSQLVPGDVAPKPVSSIPETIIPTTAAPPKAGKKVVLRRNIGIDFGTSTSKTCIRDLLANVVGLVVYPKGTAGVPEFCLPSTVTAHDGKLYFGHSAEAHSGGRVLRSLKMCVPCQKGLIACRGCSPEGAAIGRGPGEFVLRDKSGSTSVFSAEELCTLYVAHIYTFILEALGKKVDPAHDQIILSNGAAPLDQVALEPLRRIFERVFFLGRELAGKIRSGIPVDQAKQLLSELSSAYPTTPGEEDRASYLIQETIAALHGPCGDPATPRGLYAVVDIGAGTTNVTFFRLGSWTERGRTFAYYSSRTEIVGGDDIDRSILGRLLPSSALPEPGSSRYREFLQAIRLGKHDLGRDDLILPEGLRIPNAAVREAITAVGDRIYEVYRAAFKQAYQKEKLADRWEEYTILLTGGGSWVHGIEPLFEVPPHAIVKRLQLVRPKAPKGLRGADGKPMKLGPSEFLLVNLAYGLSTDRPNIPDYFAPDQVEPLKMPDPPADRDVEQLYPK